MTPTDAAQLLELPANASPDQLEARFLELRAKLEDKIAKAPTPGLKAKYRESLEQITAAFETLTLAADSSALPVVQKSKVEGPGSKVESQTNPRDSSSSTLDPRPSPVAPRKSGGSKEFAVVALIAVILLTGGGWFLVNLRTANAEQAQTEANLRTLLVEATITWDAAERELTESQRLFERFRSDLRNDRDLNENQKIELETSALTHDRYTSWLRELLAQHPLKLSRGRVESLLDTGSIEAALEYSQDLTREIAELRADLEANRGADTTLQLQVPFPDAAWKITDPSGAEIQGTGSSSIPNRAFVRQTIEVFRSPLPVERIEVDLQPQSGPRDPILVEMSHARLLLPGLPTGTVVRINDQVTPPLADGSFPTISGDSTLRLNQSNHLPISRELQVSSGGELILDDVVWISTQDPVALLQAYIDRRMEYYEESFPGYYIPEINRGLIASFRAGEFSPDQIAEYWRQFLTRVSTDADFHRRIEATVWVCHYLRFHDPELARETLEQLAEHYTALEPAERLASSRGMQIAVGAWRAAPATLWQLITTMESTLIEFATADDQELFSEILWAYIRNYRYDLAVEWQARTSAARPDLKGLETTLKNNLQWHTPSDPWEDRWEAALQTQSQAALESVAREMTAQDAAALPYPTDTWRWSVIAEVYFRLGYDQALLQFISQANHLPEEEYWQAIEIGRLDLAEQLLRRSRGTTGKDVLYMDIALAWAAQGNAFEAYRVSSAFRSATDPEIRARFPLLEALLGNRNQAENWLRLFDHEAVLANSSPSRDIYRPYMAAADEVLMNSGRAGIYAEGFDTLLKWDIRSELWTLMGRFDQAEEWLSDVGTDESSMRGYEFLYLSQRLQRLDDPLIDLKPSHFRNEQLPLVLLSLRGRQSSRSEQSIAVPLFPEVPPVLIRSTPPVFPAAARARNLPGGEVTLRVQVLANGRVGAMEVIESPDPLFSEAFKAAVAKFVYAPGIVRLETTEMWITEKGTFR